MVRPHVEQCTLSPRMVREAVEATANMLRREVRRHERSVGTP